MSRRSFTAVIAALGLAVSSAAIAADTATSVDEPPAPSGLIAIPDYHGDFWQRGYLTGDWDGTRRDWAERGVQLGVNMTNVFQAVLDGGVDETSAFSTGLDYTLDVDLDRAGILPGAMVHLRAESRFGDSVNAASGMLLPVNLDALFPLTRELDDDVPITITALNYTQFLSEWLALTIGKFNTFDSTNEFAGGRGHTQFMNGAMVFSPVAAMTVPYSTLGAGVILVPRPQLVISSLVMNLQDASTTSGFGDIGDGGWTWLTSVQWQYRLGDLPGGLTGAASYAWDGAFTRIGGGLVLVPGVGLRPTTKRDSWCVFLDAWQYVWVEQAHEGPIDVADGRQDRQGVGLFARVGFADQDTSPLEAAVTVGVAAKGLIPTRDHDTMGVAYAYNAIQTTRLSTPLGVGDAGHVVEAYYSFAITPAMQITFDLQWVDSPRRDVDDAVIFGLRLHTRF